MELLNMPETTTQDSLLGKVQFIQNHQTALNAGEYTIDIKHKIKVSQTINNEKKDYEQTFSTDPLSFVVTGDPFELNPQDIHTVFPPAGSSGDHAHVLPHIVLKRSTLPWEMNVKDGEKEAPWLALLVIYEEETQGESPSVLPIRILTLDKLNSAIYGQDLYEKEEDVSSKKIGKIYFPGLGYTSDSDFSSQTGHHFTDKVTVLDIKKKLLQTILPSLDDLRYLAHVRQNTDDQEQPIKDNEGNIIDEPLATIIANRLPKQNGTSTVYLVSLQNRYKNNQFDYRNADDNAYIRLITLKSWSFSCQESNQDFSGLLEHLTVLPSNNQDNVDQDKKVANQYLKKGYIPLPHSLRQGGKTVSWYHSPLLPAKNISSINLADIPIRCADQLIAYDEQYGLFDVSYAAAWQLGQLLALQDQKFAINLFNWKRAKVLASKQEKQMSNGQSHLVLIAQSIDTQFDTILTWLEQLRLLKNVPFNYLVPDEQMIPLLIDDNQKILRGAIRFFWLDWFWIESLLDGAFSIGRVQESDATWDNDNNPLKDKDKVITGFLLRSEVVAGWPDLQIEGFTNVNDQHNDTDKLKLLKLLRGDRLSTDVMICLFDGVINQVDISLKPEGLHFGFDVDEKDKEQLFLTLRDENGNLPASNASAEEKKKYQIDLNDNLWNEGDRVINIKNLSDEIDNRFNRSNEEKKKNPFTSEEPFTSEDLALQLIQGAKKVSFKIKSP
jgi:hypothetical protein